MCLNLKTPPIKAKVAKKNIPVWKVLEYHSYYDYIKGRYVINKNRLCSPYRGTTYELGVVKTSVLAKQATYRVERGLHSFAKRRNPRDLDGRKACFPAIIPKGALYYVGTYDGKISYASNQLLLLPKTDRRYKARKGPK